MSVFSLSSLSDLIKWSESRMTTLFDFYLQKNLYPAPELQRAMYYALSNGGKHLRPLLVYATGYIFDAPLENLDIPACAVELIHSYSLIHDDLPAMDNADLRRGKPACHKAFTEAIAILAGDALQPLAYEIIATYPSSLSVTQRLAMISLLSHASGLDGMAAGQTLDIMGTHTLSALEQMYTLKTGALFKTSIQLGILAANIQEYSALDAFADDLGLAFQIQDDLLDFENNSILIGKPIGLDSTNNKITYPSFVGIEKSHKKVQELLQNAIQTLELFGNKADLLRLLTQSILERKK